MNAIRDMANLGAHGEFVKPNDAGRVLDDLCEVLDWYTTRYGSSPPPPTGSIDVAADSTTPPPPETPSTDRTKRRVITLVVLLMIVAATIAISARVLWTGRTAPRRPEEPEVVVTPVVEVSDPDQPQ